MPAPILDKEHAKIDRGTPGSSGLRGALKAVHVLMYRLLAAQGHPVKGPSRRLKSILRFVQLAQGCLARRTCHLSLASRSGMGWQPSAGMNKGPQGFTWGKQRWDGAIFSEKGLRDVMAEMEMPGCAGQKGNSPVGAKVKEA